MRRAPAIVVLVLSCICTAPRVNAQAAGRSTGELLYLPIYSHIWHGDFDSGGKPDRTLISVSVSVRNTDPKLPIRIMSAQYYDTTGRKLKEFVQAPTVVSAMGTLELFIPRSDDSGGSGANFLIAWSADHPASPPVVEGIHANLPAGRPLVFTTSATVIPRP